MKKTFVLFQKQHISQNLGESKQRFVHSECSQNCKYFCKCVVVGNREILLRNDAWNVNKVLAKV